ncbi:MAG: FtsX-like permease family protein [Gammaproteobacteria bacterium]|nr:FtsX-like permease family protein [Gammaproteobacteria bacterium]MYE50945.1 FtsX-like permease family protein [Gammaproteobacteria bacterium]
MKLLLRSFVRFFARTPWATLTAGLGIALGVASTVATHLLGLAVSDQLGARTAPHLRGVTHVAERADATMADYFDLRRQWRRGELPQVEWITPVVQGQLVAAGRRYQVVGADGFRLAAPGSSASARRNSIRADASLELAPKAVLQLAGERWTVAEVVDAGHENAVFADIGDALALLDRPADHLDYVALSLKAPFKGVRDALERLFPGLAAGLPADVEHLAGWTVRPVASVRPEQQFGNAVLFTRGALGLLALVVAWFIIYQICVLSLRRQQLLMTRLSALGVSRRELAAGFLGAIGVLAGVATLVGIAGGHGLAALLLRLSMAGIAAPPVMEMSAVVLIKALFSGFAVALVGAGVAFIRRAPGFLQPPAGRKGVRWSGAVVALALIAAGVTLEETGLYGGFLAVLAGSLIATAWVGPLLRWLRDAFEARRTGGGYRHGSPDGTAATTRNGLLFRLAMREATWHEADLGVALGALILAVGASVGIGLMVGSFERDFMRMLDQRLAHDFFLELHDQGGAALARALREAHPGVVAVPLGERSVRLQGYTVQVGYADFTAAETARYGYAHALAPDQALASEALLNALGLSVGDSVEVGGEPLSIVHEFSGFGDVAPRLLVQAQAAAERFGALHYDRLGLSGLSAAELERWLAGAAPDVVVRQRAALRAGALDIFDRTFAITRALTLVALIVAVAGLYNAMMALRLNQRASVALLRALGLSAAEQRWLALMRGGALGVFAVVLALPLGLFIGVVLCDVINPRAFGWSVALSISAADWALPMALGLAAAVAASVLPVPEESA